VSGGAGAIGSATGDVLIVLVRTATRRNALQDPTHITLNEIGAGRHPILLTTETSVLR
jgi:hypothetical protein